jgi:hypothetical protein
MTKQYPLSTGHFVELEKDKHSVATNRYIGTEHLTQDGDVGIVNFSGVIHDPTTRMTTDVFEVVAKNIVINTTLVDVLRPKDESKRYFGISASMSTMKGASLRPRVLRERKWERGAIKIERSRKEGHGKIM